MAEPAQNSELLNAALGFLASGCSIVPTRSDGSKAPIGSWKKWQSEKPTAAQVAEWFSDPKVQGFGVVTGKVSGNLELLELEGRAVNAGLLEEVKEIAFASGLGEIWNVLINNYVEMTPSGGIHFLYRIADEDVPGNTKLARQPGENGGVEVLAETRGEAGFCIVAPSFGTTHPSGQPWVLINGSPALLPMLSMEERNAIHACFRALDKMPTIETVREATAPKTDDGIKSPGTDYNERATWDDILIPRGWAKVFSAKSGVTYWRRPGKNTGISATTGRNDGDNLFVFTTSSEFQAEMPYSKFAALALLEFNNDFKACAKELRKRGFGSVQAVPDLVKLGDSNSLPSFQGQNQSHHLKEGDGFDGRTSDGEPTQVDGDAITLEHTSWLPKHLNLDSTQEEPKPEFLPREDGEFLIYRGKVNGLLGESESGKTWVALFAVQQALAKRQRVIYLDFEDSASGILSRLRALGSIDDHFENLLYASPDETLTLAASADLYSALADFKPDLVVLDGVNAAMTLLGLDLNSNTDATKFSQAVLKPLKSQGAGVLTIDHVTKNKDSRGNYAIGAQSKRADIDGCAISVAVVAPFGRGQNGELKMTVTKDRPGHVRAIALGAKAVGVAHLRSAGEDKVRIMIEGLRDKAGGGFRPTHLMEKVSKLLEASSGPLSKSAVEKGVEGKADAIRVACQTLIDDGFVKVENGQRNSLMLNSIKPYRETDDPSSNEYKWKDIFNEEKDTND